MKLKEISVTLQRPIRHAPYRVSIPSVTVVGLMEDGADPNKEVEELFADAKLLLQEAVTETIKIYEETEGEIISHKTRSLNGNNPS